MPLLDNAERIESLSVGFCPCSIQRSRWKRHREEKRHTKGKVSLVLLFLLFYPSIIGLISFFFRFNW